MKNWSVYGLRAPRIWSSDLSDKDCRREIRSVMDEAEAEQPTGSAQEAAPPARSFLPVMLDQSAIHFSQGGISASFKNGESIFDVLRRLRSGSLSVYNFPAIEVVVRDGIDAILILSVLCS